MARSAKRHKVLQHPMILPVNVRPLDDLWLMASTTTSYAPRRLPFLPSYPLVKPTITDAITFPKFMSVILKQSCERPIVGLRIFTMPVCVACLTALFLKFFISCKGITFARTKVSWLNFRRRTDESLLTSQTRNFNHMDNVSTNIGEMQYA